MKRCQSLLVALAFDALLGELPNQVHPVVAMGRYIALGEDWAPVNQEARLLWGAGWLAGGAALCAAAAAGVPRHPLLQGAVITTLFAYRALDRAVSAVRAALACGDLPEARRLLGRHLVSRPTDELSAAEVAAAAIESLAENLSDSVVAPLSWYLLGGLPGLAAYRFSNTADAMWGYRNECYEYLGKAAARADDLLNLIPARLTAALIVPAAHLTNGRGREAWRVACRDHGRTASPNAGWPMAAMAGALDTMLTKRGHYSLGDGARPPDAALIAEAQTIARRVLLLLVGALALGAVYRRRSGSTIDDRRQTMSELSPIVRRRSSNLA